MLVLAGNLAKFLDCREAWVAKESDDGLNFIHAHLETADFVFQDKFVSTLFYPQHSENCYNHPINPVV